MKNLNISIAGLGNVGSDLIKTIINNNVFIKNKSDLSINVIGISAKNFLKKRSFNIKSYNWFDNPKDLLKLKDLNVFVELIGEEKGISYELVKLALKKKINVITANKALLAKNGLELFEIAEKNNVLLLYEAAVAGGIPIIKTLKNNIFLNKIKKISGILNGTTNYILTTMYKDNLSFNKVLSMAKNKGYTSESEADLDIGGLDSAHKLTLLTTICFGSKINFSNNEITGIENVQILDIINAEKLGFKIKLISEAYIFNDEIYCVTGPKFITNSNPLANVDGVLNAIKIETDQLKSLFLAGEGAGGKATASSILSDLLEISSNTNILSLGYKNKNLINFKKFDTLHIESAFYLRIMVKDETGVLSKITGFFKDFNISIEKIFQLPDNNKMQTSIPIVIVTHSIKKNILLMTIDKIENQRFVLEKINIIPID